MIWDEKLIIIFKIQIILKMESIEQRINDTADEWQDYCLPDKIDILKPKVQEYIAELDALLEKNRNSIIIQRKTKKKRLNSTI